MEVVLVALALAKSVVVVVPESTDGSASVREVGRCVKLGRVEDCSVGLSHVRF
jgi:hypothetical protein